MKRALAALALLAAACGSAPAAKAPEAEAPKMRLSPIADLVPAAGLSWLIVAEPRAIAARADVMAAVHQLTTDERLREFAIRNGGVDPRAIEEMAVAKYADSTLFLARTAVDPARVEAAFAARVGVVEGRAIDRKGAPRDQIVRAWGEGDGGGREQIAIFGVEAVGLEQGKLGPLRAAELFADRRLKRASPALRGAPLARAAELIGDAPVRAFAPGPFEGETSRGFGGLLAASTALALAVRFPNPSARQTAAGGPIPASMTVVLVGAWGADAGAAAERLLAVYGTVAASAIGRLCGLEHSLAGPRTRSTPDAITLEVTVDARAVAHGLHAALDAQVDEIMRYGAPHAPAPLTPVPKQ